MFQNWVQWMLLEQRVPFVYCGSVCGLHTYEMTSKQDVFRSSRFISLSCMNKRREFQSIYI